MTDVLAWLEEWYARRCDGDWEHVYGVSIETVDNPGWSVEIDLRGTPMDGKSMPEETWEQSESDWSRCFVKDNKFIGAGDPSKLTKIIEYFRYWVEQHGE